MPYRDDDPAEPTEKVPVPPPLPAILEFPRTRLEQLWLDHRRAFDRQLSDFRNEVLSAIVAERVPASKPEPSSARQKVAATVAKGALAGTKWASYASLAITIALLLAKAFKPGLVSPLESLGKLLSGDP